MVFHPNQLRDGVGGWRGTEEGAGWDSGQITPQRGPQENFPSFLPPPHLGSLLFSFGAPAP